MMKLVLHGAVLVMLTITLAACSSPEEKAAGHISNADKFFDEGNLLKAQVEYKTALQINQNLPSAWFGLAKIHEQKQEWKEVYGALNRVREMTPNHVDSRIMLGQLLLASNQLDQLLTEAREILEMAPDDARSHSLMAALQFRLENFDSALEEVDKALMLDPEQSDALLVRARVLIAEKRHDEALAELNRAIEKHSDNAVFYLMKLEIFSKKGDRQAVENVYLAMIDQFPDDVRVKQALARHYLEDKNIDAAERILQQIADSETGNADHRIRLVGFKRQYRSLDESITLVNSYIDQARNEYRYRFLLGELYEVSKQVDKAIEVYNSIVFDDGIQPNGLEARIKIAAIELQAGKRDRALTLINEVLAQEKSNENALLLQASLQLTDEKVNDAIVSARTVLRDNPDSIKALSVLGHAYNANGSIDLAIESFTKAFQLSPGNPFIANQLAANLLRQRKTAQADEVLRKSFSSGNRSVDSLKLAAQIKLSLGEWDQAEQLAALLQKVEGQEAVSQELLGEVYRGKQDEEASIRAFKRAHELSPESEKTIASLVRTYLENGKVDEAKNFLNSVLAADSDSLIAYLLLGQVSLYEKDIPKAIEHFNKMIAIDPKSVVAYRNLNAIYVNQNDLEEAEIVTRQGLSSNPDSTMLSMNLAQLHEMRGDFDKAIQIYDNLLKIDSDLIVAKNNLASLLTDYGDGQDSFEKARVVAADLKNSEIPQFRDTYAWASVVAGTNLEEAIVILEGIVRENAHVGAYNYHLGEAYRRKGDSENAIAYLNEAVKVAGPESDIAEKARQSLQKIQ